MDPPGPTPRTQAYQALLQAPQAPRQALISPRFRLRPPELGSESTAGASWAQASTRSDQETCGDTHKHLAAFSDINIHSTYIADAWVSDQTIALKRNARLSLPLMSVYSFSRLGRLSQRQPMRVSFHRSNHDVAERKRGPTGTVKLADLNPSQLLRFAMTGNSLPAGETAEGRQREAEQVIRRLLDKRLPNTPPMVELKQSKPDMAPNLTSRPLADVHTVRQMRYFVERHLHAPRYAYAVQMDNCEHIRQALRRCEPGNSSADILVVLNGLIARIERFSVPVSEKLYIMGMEYACRAWHPAALYTHIKGYLHTTTARLDYDSSVRLVRCLLDALETIQFNEPLFSTHAMTGVITGEDAPTQCRLHDILCWADGQRDSMEEYVTLLIKIQSEFLLRGAVDRTLAGIFPDAKFPVQAMYTAATVSLYDKYGLNVLKTISRHCDGALPGLSTFRDLNTLLARRWASENISSLAGETEYAEILQRQLGEMEARLGIAWQPLQAVHTHIANPHHVASNTALLTLDGDAAGYDSIERFLTELRVSGRSREAGNLARIADLLHEHDGSQIRVSLAPVDEVRMELAWRPQCSPIEFSDAPGHWKFWARGLMRGRLDSDGVAVPHERSLHLMQLGYLVMRRSSDASAFASSDAGWAETGHVVVLNRVTGRLLIVFLGKGYGSVSAGVPAGDVAPPRGLGRIESISVPGYFEGEELPRCVREARFHFGIAGRRSLDDEGRERLEKSAGYMLL